MEETHKNYNDELVERCRHGEESAFTMLYTRHAKSLYNSIYRLVKHSGEAEDILQECFITAYQQIDSFAHENHFSAWIRRVGINKSISLLRKKNIHFIEIDSLTNEEAEQTNEGDISFKIDEIKKAISELPTGYRTILTLYAIENISQEEIGNILGISHNTVRSLYHRAKACVLKKLKKGELS